MNRTHYIFVDFENIHEIQIELIAHRPAVVILVLGERHKKLSVDLVKKFLAYPTQVRLVEAGRSGRNALDFVLAYLIGVQAMTDPTGHFHILSRDKGFDALIEHLKKNDLMADRHEAFAKIPILAPSTRRAETTMASKSGAASRREKTRPTIKVVASKPDRTEQTIAWFTANKLNRPKTRKKLLSHIYTHFGKRIATGELESIAKELVARDAIEITPDGKVVYRL